MGNMDYEQGSMEFGMEHQGSWQGMVPLWPGPLGMGQGLMQPGMGQALSWSKVAVQLRFNPPGCSPHPFNYGAGLGGAAGSSPLSFAAAGPEGAAAAAPQGAAAAVDADAWLRKAYAVPPNAFINTINYIDAQEHINPSVPIAEIFDFAKSLRAAYRDNFAPGRNQPSPRSLK